MSPLISAIIHLDILARKTGIRNIFQPGLAKELLIAETLGHRILQDKKGADAEIDGKMCEYLSCKEGGSGQMDRMFSSPHDKLERSIARITRNDFFYLVIFDRSEMTKILRIWDLPINEVEQEARRQLARSSNAISHVGFNEKFAAQVGKIHNLYK